MFKFDPPANIDDLDTDESRPRRDAFRDDWHRFIKDTIDRKIQALGDLRPKIEPQFGSEANGAFPGDAVPATWNAFPLSISRRFPQNSVGAWQAANKLGAIDLGPTRVTVRRQDEYCEWFEHREGGKLSRITFTAEAPEYWIRLASHDLNRVVQLYREWISPEVEEADLLLAQDLVWLNGSLLKAGSYNPYNKWTTTRGAMHLTHPANTLGAEIDLASRATILRADASGKRVTDVRQLACCSDFGDFNRSSDPNIGSKVNTTCVSPDGSTILDVTLANPIALYIGALQEGTLTGPDDEVLDDWFTFVRGVKGRGLRAVLAPPPGATFGLDQLKVKGVPLEYGGQVAEVIQMLLYAKARPHVESGVGVRLFRCLDNCCVPAGTPRAEYKKINFTSPDERTHKCESGSETAYRVAAAPGGSAPFSKIGTAFKTLEIDEEQVDFSSPGARTATVVTLD